MQTRPLVILTVAALLSGAAFAQSTPPPAQDASLRAIPGGDVRPYQPAEPKQKGIDCIRETGTATQRNDAECVPANGKSYSKDQLDKTGETKLGPALQKLDPSIRTRGR